MKSILLALVVSWGAVASALAAQTQTAPSASGQAAVAAAPAPTQRSAAELEKLVEPIALHPDPLISIILPASAYPLEIVQAARFVRDTNNIPKVDAQSWDDNVKEVAKFPELISKMDADLPWTMDLGQAFIDQPKELMDAIQNLRAKAKKSRHAPDQSPTNRHRDQRCRTANKFNRGGQRDQGGGPSGSRQPASRLCAQLSSNGLLSTARLCVQPYRSSGYLRRGHGLGSYPGQQLQLGAWASRR